MPKIGTFWVCITLCHHDCHTGTKMPLLSQLLRHMSGICVWRSYVVTIIETELRLPRHKYVWKVQFWIFRFQDAHNNFLKSNSTQAIGGAWDGCLQQFLTRQPACDKFGMFKPYQLKGPNWMIQLAKKGLNGILVDEMGLGKVRGVGSQRGEMQSNLYIK